MHSLLLRLALLCTPAEFRHNYAAQIEEDARRGPEGSSVGQLLLTCLDLAGTGVALHAERIARDVIVTLRGLAKARLFAIVSIAAIALAIGANVAVVSVLK